MNVLKVVMNVMNTVTIPLVVILATVLDLVIDFVAMELPVKVSNISYNTSLLKININTS